MADAFKKLDKKIVSSLGITKRTKPVAFDKWMDRLNVNTESESKPKPSKPVLPT